MDVETIDTLHDGPFTTLRPQSPRIFVELVELVVETLELARVRFRAPPISAEWFRSI